MRNTLILIGVALLAGCQGIGSKGDEETQVATEWARAWFGCDYPKAQRLMTPESERYVRFAASNITEADLQVVNSQEEGPQVEAEGSETYADTVAVVGIVVTNYLQRDSIGQPGHIVRRGTFSVPLLRRNGKWRVHLTSARIPQ